MDGWTVMEKLKSNPQTRHIPVHFISAAEQSIQAKRMGAIGYSLKPVSITEVGETFKKIAQFIEKTTKQVLAIIENIPLQQKIQEWVENDTTLLYFATTMEEATTHLQETPFDCIIIDISVGHAISLEFLDYLKNNKAFSQIPTIVYATHTLTPEESETLEQYADNLPVKTVQSHERLLNEVTLFLHQVASQLPKEKQAVLRSMYEKEAVLANKKVLVVDDDSRNVFALTVVLDEKGMNVSNCENGQQALNFLAEQPDINIVLMDIMMPGMDGYETIRQIRAQPHFQKLPIIALTAKAMKGDKAKCIEAGANDYLAKPVDTEQLISLMRVWLYNA
jgi:CheY-like chemotaxis protein